MCIRELFHNSVGLFWCGGISFDGGIEFQRDFYRGANEIARFLSLYFRCTSVMNTLHTINPRILYFIYIFKN